MGNGNGSDILEDNPLIPQLARVQKKITESADTISLRLVRADSRPLGYRPGQFNMLGLPGFKEAPFSFSSLEDYTGTFVHTIRAAGNVVSALCRLRQGDHVTFRGPFGTGWPLDKALGRNLILVAGGIGMAPLRPVVDYVRENRDSFRDVFLLYGAKTTDDLLYRRQLAQWNEEITVLLAADRVRGELPLPVQEGVVTKLLPRVHTALSETISFMCGPQVMIKFAAGALLLDGQSAGDIYVSLERRMECGVAQCGHCQIGAKFVCKDGPVFALADITRFQDTLL
ncbi:MAG: FAD/NAD(P)-binding protein [Planctomycetes bacterium]|nr:FAD/NAD(P)-binding protein [Planctomycetota bacterium]